MLQKVKLGRELHWSRTLPVRQFLVGEKKGWKSPELVHLQGVLLGAVWQKAEEERDPGSILKVDGDSREKGAVEMLIPSYYYTGVPHNEGLLTKGGGDSPFAPLEMDASLPLLCFQMPF